MKVRSKVTRASLIKGKVYEVERIYNAYRKRHTHELNVIGINANFPLKCFETLQGEKIKAELYVKDWRSVYYKLRNGDFLRSVSKKTNSLEYGKIYEIQDVSLGYDTKVNFKNDPTRYYTLNRENFDLVDKAYMRDKQLDSILEDSNIEALEYDGKPYFEEYEKECEIISLLQRSLLYKRKTKVDATLKEIINHFCNKHPLITKEDVMSFNYKEILDEGNSC